MRIRYTSHARRRLRERAVAEAEIEAVLSSPDIRYTDLNGNPVFVKTTGTRRIGVVVAVGTEPPRVITVIVYD